MFLLLFLLYKVNAHVVCIKNKYKKDLFLVQTQFAFRNMMMILCLSVYLKLNKVTIIYTVFTSRRALHFLCILFLSRCFVLPMFSVDAHALQKSSDIVFCVIFAELNEFYVEYVSGLFSWKGDKVYVCLNGIFHRNIYCNSIFICLVLVIIEPKYNSLGGCLS